MLKSKQSSLWKSLHAGQMQEKVTRGLVIAILPMHFKIGNPLGLLVTEKPGWLMQAITNKSRVLNLIYSIEIVPTKRELDSIGLVFLDLNSIPDGDVKEFWVARCREVARSAEEAESSYRRTSEQ